MTTTAIPTAPNAHGQLPTRVPAKPAEAGPLLAIVLDAGDQRDATAERLHAEGFEVRFSDHTQGLVEAVQSSSPDVVVIDVLKDGLEPLRKLRSLELQVPVIVLSDRHDPEPMRLGASATMTKPVDLTVLAQRARQAAADQQAPRSLQLGDDGCPFELPADGVDLEAVERGLLAQALVRTNGNQSRAARLLGISRYALRYRMQKFKLA